MNYELHYNKLINRARGRLLEGYTEKHHIIPRCMNGSDDAENIVRLTAEEHYVAHQLLVKMHPGNHSIIYAALRMAQNADTNQRPSNRLYGWLRRQFAVSQSAEMKRNPSSSVWKKGHKPWNKGLKTSGFKGKKHSIETKAKMSASALARPPVSDETRRKLSETAKRRAPISDETRKKKSIAMKGKIPWNKGIPATDKHKRNLSIAKQTYLQSRNI